VVPAETSVTTPLLWGKLAYCTTVRVVDPLMEFMIAVMVVVPTLALEATPLGPMVATVGAEEVHVTEPLMTCVVLSPKVPVAVNGNVWPSNRLGVDGMTVMDTSLAFETVRLAEPRTGLSSAPISVLPCATAVARPRLGEESLMVATANSEEVHSTKPLRFRML
jgi:hypothetical protein